MTFLSWLLIRTGKLYNYIVLRVSKLEKKLAHTNNVDNYVIFPVVFCQDVHKRNHIIIVSYVSSVQKCKMPSLNDCFTTVFLCIYHIFKICQSNTARAIPFLSSIVKVLRLNCFHLKLWFGVRFFESEELNWRFFLVVRHLLVYTSYR